MKLPYYFSFLFIVILSTYANAQQNHPPKFGDISEKDFAKTVYPIDSNADAIVFYDIGQTEIGSQFHGGLFADYSKSMRAHILHKNGYNLANIVIPVVVYGAAQHEFINLEATTYNLVDGKVIKTEINPKTDVYEDKINQYVVFKKFSFPNVKEGSIIEFRCTIRTYSIFALPTWEFQRTFPTLWSEYTVSIPDFLHYVFMSKINLPLSLSDEKIRESSFDIWNKYGKEEHVFSNVVEKHWVMENIPAIHEEEFTTTIKNHISKIEFQLSEKTSPLYPSKILNTWPTLTQRLLLSDDFGVLINKDNPWLNEITDSLIQGSQSNLDKTQRVFAYVRDNFKCSDHSDWFPDKTLKEVFKSKNGSMSEINLLLVAMLRKVDIETANPLLLSTRSNGYSTPLYPILNYFNCLVATFETQGQRYFLDASDSHLGFGKLNYECYNGHARVIDFEATAVELSPDTLLEKSYTSAFMTLEETGKINGIVKKIPGYFESCTMRDSIKEKNSDAIFEKIQMGFDDKVSISDKSIDSLKQLENPLGLKFSLSFPTQGNDILYINPLLNERLNENPFHAAIRNYPVEMPYRTDKAVLFTIRLPANYSVEELPKSGLIKMNEAGDCTYEYAISEANGIISLRSRMHVNKTFFDAIDYDLLREFFTMVVAKQNEQIVLKKKS